MFAAAEKPADKVAAINAARKAADPAAANLTAANVVIGAPTTTATGADLPLTVLADDRRVQRDGVDQGAYRQRLTELQGNRLDAGPVGRATGGG